MSNKVKSCGNCGWWVKGASPFVDGLCWCRAENHPCVFVCEYWLDKEQIERENAIEETLDGIQAANDKRDEIFRSIFGH